VSNGIIKVFVKEKGFGNPKGGRATVVAGPNGEPLIQRLTILPDERTGGTVVLIPFNLKHPICNTSINSKEIVYKIVIFRTGEMSNINITRFDCTGDEITKETFSTSFIPDGKGGAKFVESEGMERSGEAKELLTTILTDAVNRGIQRSYDSFPERLYYGIIAKDCKPLIMQKYIKSTNVNNLQEFAMSE